MIYGLWLWMNGGHVFEVGHQSLTWRIN